MIKTSLAAKAACVLLGISACLTAGACSSKVEWRRVYSSRDGYEADFPGRAKCFTNGWGEECLLTQSGLVFRAVLSFSSTDVDMQWNAQRQTFLDENLRLRLAAPEEPVRMGGVEGVEFVVKDLRDGYGLLRVFPLSHRRLLFLSVLIQHPGSPETARWEFESRRDWVDRFLGSVRIK